MKPFEIFVSAIALSIALFHSTMGYSSPDSYSIAEDGLLKLVSGNEFRTLYESIGRDLCIGIVHGDVPFSAGTREEIWLPG